MNQVEAEVVAGKANEVLEERRQEVILLQKKKEAWREMMAGGFIPNPVRAYDHTGANMVVQCVQKDESVGGILLPEDAREVAGVGKVLVVGNGCRYKRGDYVFFSPSIGASVVWPSGDINHEFRVVSEDEVYGAWPAELVTEREPRE